MKPGRPEPSEAGFSLAELVLTVAIMGIALVVIVEGMWMSVLSSDIHRRQAGAETVLRSYAEAVKHGDYKEDCKYDSFTPPDPERYGIASECPPDPRLGQGLQKVKLTVSLKQGRSVQRLSETVELIKRASEGSG